MTTMQNLLYLSFDFMEVINGELELSIWNFVY
jgi:hypothetical protein